MSSSLYAELRVCSVASSDSAPPTHVFQQEKLKAGLVWTADRPKVVMSSLTLLQQESEDADSMGCDQAPSTMV